MTITGTFSASTLRVLKPVGAACSASSVGQQHAGARQQHERGGDLRDGEQRAAGGSCPPVMRTLPLRQAETLRRVGRGQPRHEGEQDGGGDRQRRRRPTAGSRRPSGRARAPRTAPRTARARRPSAGRSATPRIAPAPQSSRLSASSVRRSAPALAPSAARIASSPSRRTERARIRLATFEQAMTKTSPEAASRTSSTVRAGEVI